MKRQLIIATLALATAGVSGCGDSGPEAVGKDVGASIGSLQSTVMTKTANERLDGIENRIESLKGKIPADVYKQLEAIDQRLESDVEAATNHPAALAQASVDARDRLNRLASSSDAAVREFLAGVRDGYAHAAN